MSKSLSRIEHWAQHGERDRERDVLPQNTRVNVTEGQLGVLSVLRITIFILQIGKHDSTCAAGKFPGLGAS